MIIIRGNALLIMFFPLIRWQIQIWINVQINYNSVVFVSELCQIWHIFSNIGFLCQILLSISILGWVKSFAIFTYELVSGINSMNFSYSNWCYTQLPWIMTCSHPWLISCARGSFNDQEEVEASMKEFFSKDKNWYQHDTKELAERLHQTFKFWMISFVLQQCGLLLTIHY